MSLRDTPPPPQSVINFLAKNYGPQYMHFDIELKHMLVYLDLLWWRISPYKHSILNMGIGSSTPLNLLTALNYNVNVVHVELDKKRKVKVSDQEQVLWKTDFYEYLKKARKDSFDGVVFWHGPEHLEAKSGRKAIRQSLRVAKKWVIVSCPWDRLKGWKAGKSLGRKARRKLGHKSIWTENSLLKLGFKTLTVGTRGVHPSFLLGWKIN